jgi:hypothetical protein
MATNPDFYIEPCGFVSYYGDQARQILRQYAEAGFNSCASLTYRGPHYVIWERGEFYLRPFGPWARYKHSFRCIPEFFPGEAEPLWCFSVMC